MVFRSERKRGVNMAVAPTCLPDAALSNLLAGLCPSVQFLRSDVGQTDRSSSEDTNVGVWHLVA